MIESKKASEIVMAAKEQHFVSFATTTNDATFSLKPHSCMPF